MPQFRLTKKFAGDLKIAKLIEPTEVRHPLDDWVIDRMIVERKKVAIITHVKTAFTFFISYADAGGAKNIVFYFKEQLTQLFLEHSLSSLVSEVNDLFEGDIAFSKTDNRKIIGYMTDFKRCTKPYPSDPRPINWKDISQRMNQMPLNAGSHDSFYAIEKFNALLKIDLPTMR